MQMLSNRKPKARKEHFCQGWQQICHFTCKGEITEEELPDKNHKIEKGEVYVKQAFVADGDFYDWCSCQKCYDLIVKYKLWDDY